MNISFEFFPARTEHGEKALNRVQKELSAIKPEFFLSLLELWAHPKMPLLKQLLIS